MITLIEALNYRCLHYIKQPLGPFHVLVGPNASGKTTFLDVVAFLGRLVSDGIDAAVMDRTQNFQDLVWAHKGNRFELAIEAKIPDDRQKKLVGRVQDTLRYEVAIGTDASTEQTVILAEKVLLKSADEREKIHPQRLLFPAPPSLPDSILTSKAVKGKKLVINRVPGGNDNYYPEVSQESEKRWALSMRLGNRKSLLGNLPEDESKFPVSTWFKTLLSEGVQRFILNSQMIQKASPPGQGRGFKTDGSNLPWVVADLEKKSPPRFRAWIRHLKTALPDIETIRTVERADVKHRHLVIRYKGGLDVPSWMASDGTLRMLALTLPAYLQDFKGVYLIEEPENGVHPRAVETVFQSLSSVYDAQMLLATHSPIMLSTAKAEQILCFAKTTEGATDIVPGNKHPALKEWKGETNLGDFFAAGVLG